ncbi:flavodoxin family protein [Sphingobacterium kyonggiense]
METFIHRRVVIIGSSRENGNTKQAVKELSSLLDFDIIDLNDFEFSYYDYRHNNKNDDFLALMERIINNYDLFIFATPVYWYSMSGVMKVFFDRMTDLLDIEKELGRKLRNKKMAVISSSIGDNLKDNFWLPFKATAKYLGMNYIGDVHTVTKEDNRELLKKFSGLINLHES